MVDAAVRAGADAVKFQSFRAEEVVTPSAPKAAYQRQTTDPGQTQLAMLQALQLTPQGHRALIERCRQRGIAFLSTPFDEPSLDLLVSLGTPAIKVPSGEITNLPFLSRVGGAGRPVILSTGMSYLEEVTQAVEAISGAGCRQLALLHCVSSYPAPMAEVNLRAMLTLAQAFGLAVGYSDHTLGLEAPLAAVALGASLIEKHFTLDPTLPGPDHQASASPGQLQTLVQCVRAVEAALGHGRKEPAPSEADTRTAARRSLVAMVEIPAGERLAEWMLAARRPGTGLPPSQLSQILGRRLARLVKANTAITWEDLA
jgi:N-acetylneuraminate synthase